MLDKLKKKLHEEALLMKVEAVTDNVHVNTKRHKMFVRLIQLCGESLANTDLIFAALRARLSDGLTFNRHLSVIKILWLIELLANYGIARCLITLARCVACDIVILPLGKESSH